VESKRARGLGDDGGGLGKGGMMSLFIDGNKVGDGRVDKMCAMMFSLDKTLDIGNEYGSPVNPDYPKPKKFSGEVNWVEIDAEDLDHLITPEERLRLAMAIQ
jgi:hypothetical protein